MEKRKKLELVLMCLYFVLVSFLVANYQIAYLPSALLYFGIPTVIITFMKKEYFKKTFLYSLLLALPGYLIVDYIFTISKAWHVHTVKGIYLFNLIPIEDFVWAFLFIYSSIYFYEYFFPDKKYSNKFSPQMKYAVGIIAIMLIIFGVIYKIDGSLFSIQYGYLIFIIGMAIITLLGFLTKQIDSSNLWVNIFYFPLLGVIYDIAAVKVPHWTYPGEYIGFITLLDSTFVIEEFLFFIIAPLASIALYRYFASHRN